MESSGDGDKDDDDDEEDEDDEDEAFPAVWGADKRGEGDVDVPTIVIVVDEEEGCGDDRDPKGTALLGAIGVGIDDSEYLARESCCCCCCCCCAGTDEAKAASEFIMAFTGELEVGT